MDSTEQMSQKEIELKIQKHKIDWMVKQLKALDETIQEEKALSLAERIKRAKEAYTLDEYIMYTEPKYIKEGSPAYLKRQAEYEHDMRQQAQVVLRNAQKARRRLLKEFKRMGR